MSLNYAPILFTKEELVSLVQGRWLQNEPKGLLIKGIFISPEQYSPQKIFIAAGGFSVQKRQDYVVKILNKGVVTAIIDKEVQGLPCWSSVLLVDNTEKALESLAEHARRKSAAQIIAVTGSVGKTSIKETLAKILAAQGSAFSSFGSINGGVGLKNQLAILPKNIDFGVFEIGMLGPNSIKPRAEYISPKVALISSLAPAHIKYHDGMDSIVKSKADIAYGVENKGSVVIPRDSVFFDKLYAYCRTVSHNIKIITFGEHESSDCKLIAFTKCELGGVIKANILGEELEYRISLEGRFWVLNSIAILACVKLVGADVTLASEMFEYMQPESRRGERFRVELKKGKVLELIDDTFNANPASMCAAIQLLSDRVKPKHGRKILIIGDMEELGADEIKYHCELKKIIEESSIDCIFTVGNKMQSLFSVLEHKEAYYVKNSELMAEELYKFVKHGDLILVKGSNKTAMNKVINKFFTKTKKDYIAPIKWSLKREMEGVLR